jgi:hypothetical protein
MALYENKRATYQNAMMSTRTTIVIWMNLLEQTSSSFTFKWLHLLCLKVAAESLLVTESDPSFVRFGVLTAVGIKSNIFWYMKTRGLVDSCSHNNDQASEALALGTQS